jgi:signal transduction histidine kinase
MDRRDFLVDGAIALAAFALSAAVIAAAGADPGLRDPDALALALVAAHSASVVLRRRRPVAAVALSLATGFAYSAAKYPPALVPLMLLTVYSAATALPERPSRWVLVTAVVVSALASTAGPGPTSISLPLLAAGAWFLGNSVRTRRLYTETLEAKNRELELAQHELARQAVTEERLRIARELHDVVAHSMSVVAVHAGTGRMVAGDDPAAAERALATIEATTRSALGEMRRLLGVLRSSDGDEPAALGPAPGLADLDRLVADVARSGVDVGLRVHGDRPDMPPGVDLSAYRVVQEALTNVIRHAGPARATVDVRYTGAGVTVEVADDGRGAAMPPAPGGHGLVGMRERVGVHGGELDAGPGPTGGFRVVATFPLGEAS